MDTPAISYLRPGSELLLLPPTVRSQILRHAGLVRPCPISLMNEKFRVRGIRYAKVFHDHGVVLPVGMNFKLEAGMEEEVWISHMGQYTCHKTCESAKKC